MAIQEKGAGWERNACGRLSLWVTNLQKEDVFWRTATSGGRATFRLKQNAAGKNTRGRALGNQAGDVSAIDPAGHLLMSLFVIECKFWRDITFADIVFGREGYITPEWRKVCAAAKDLNKEPMFLAKQNKKGEVMCTTMGGWNLLRAGLEDPMGLRIHAHFPQLGMFVFQFRDLLTDVDFDKIRATYENRTSFPDSSLRTHPLGIPGSEFRSTVSKLDRIHLE